MKQDTRLKLSFITTVFNDENGIEELLKSLSVQSKRIDEIIVCDAFSSDKTLEKIFSFRKLFKEKGINLIFFRKKGNRSIGRNEAIRKSRGDIILVSDSGCILDKNWVKEITSPFTSEKIDVVSGYYKPVTRNVFEKCLSTYTCVMPDKIDKNNFLPSSRSVAFKKSVWKKVGKYPEELDTCEDLVFAKRTQDMGAEFYFQKKAVVYWPQRNNIFEAVKQFFSYAIGDGRAHFFRGQTPFLYFRALIFIYLLTLIPIYKSYRLYSFMLLAITFYIIWSVVKNYRYIKKAEALFYLPLLQVAADIAVVSGTTIGYIQSFSFYKFYSLLKQNKLFILLIIIYSLLMISIINWGIPNNNHPFNYHMDEWHQSQAVRTTIKFGTPNTVGSANGTVFQFYLSGTYLAILTLLKIVNPLAIKSAISSISIQHAVFIALRINTLIFGLLSIWLIYYISKKYFNTVASITVLLFIFNPVWLSLSNFFKYDISLIFWLVLSLLMILRYGREKTLSSYLVAGVFTGLSFAVKVSALPMFALYLFSFFLYSENIKRELKFLIYGSLTFLLVAALFGTPDLLFGHGDYTNYLYSNLISTPKDTQNFYLGIPLYPFLIIREFPVLFGRFEMGLFISSLIYLIFSVSKRLFYKKDNFSKNELFISLSLIIFGLSLTSLGIYAGSNRALVLLPFIAIICGIFTKRIFIFTNKNVRIILFGLLTIGLLFQIFEALSIVYLRIKPDIREISSQWLLRNVKKNSTIGIENVPIYQFVPDITLKEYYAIQYDKNTKTNFNYLAVDYATRELPSRVVISDDEINLRYIKKSPKKLLVERLIKENYMKKIVLKPDFGIFSFLNNSFIFYISGIYVSPDTITIYEKS